MGRKQTSKFVVATFLPLLERQKKYPQIYKGGYFCITSRAHNAKYLTFNPSPNLGEGHYFTLLYNSSMNNQQKLEELEKKLVKYKAIFLEKKKVFRGVKHESSISELRYTEFMVYKNMVEGLEREIGELKVRK